MLKILQPLVPHYRSEFFTKIRCNVETTLYYYESDENAKRQNFHDSGLNKTFLKSWSVGNFLFYNPLIFLTRDCDVLVLMLHPGHISSWILLLTKVFHKKKIILWGHGISIHNYLKEVEKESILKKTMLRLADEIWFYTENEQELWNKRLPNLKSVALGNTLSNLHNLLYLPKPDVSSLLSKYNIKTKKNIIFCARFNNPHRRVDLLELVINSLDPNVFGFVIIGNGNFKPDFSKYTNVYDFGEVYDKSVKDELFAICSIYFQPGWLGLSLVEAMAYGKAIFTMRRSEDILQCVEYGYLTHMYNGCVFDDIDTLVNTINSLNESELDRLGLNARQYVLEKLTMENMVNKALESIMR